MQIRRRFQFHHHQSARVIHRQQIQNAAIAAGERRHLPIHRLRPQRRVQNLQMRAGLRFQPRFRVLAIERMVAVRRLGRPRTLELRRHAFHLLDIPRTSRMALAQSESQILSIEFGELDAAHAQARATAALQHLFDAGQRGQALPARTRIRRRAAKRFEMRIQIPVIVRIHCRNEILARIAE